MSKSALKSAIATKTNVADALQSVLQETYSLYLLTHNYHWNVEGQNFYSLHKLFDEQYNELFLAIDEVAERIRALDAYALPDYSTLAKSIDALTENATKKKDRNAAALQMAETLLKANEDVVESAQRAKRLAESVSDDETVDLMVVRIEAHQKAAWMLRSTIK